MADTNHDSKTTDSKDHDLNPDAITGEPGSHPVGTGVGSASGMAVGSGAVVGSGIADGSGAAVGSAIAVGSSAPVRLPTSSPELPQAAVRTTIAITTQVLRVTRVFISCRLASVLASPPNLAVRVQHAVSPNGRR